MQEIIPFAKTMRNPRSQFFSSAATLQQLNAANIQLIYARRGDDSMIRILGLDGRSREL